MGVSAGGWGGGLGTGDSVFGGDGQFVLGIADAGDLGFESSGTMVGGWSGTRDTAVGAMDQEVFFGPDSAQFCESDGGRGGNPLEFCRVPMVGVSVRERGGSSVGVGQLPPKAR